MVRIGTLNCRGGASKIRHIIETAKKYNLDVLKLQEIHRLKPNHIKSLEEETKMKCFASFGTDLARGVLTLVKESNYVRDVYVHSSDTDGNTVTVKMRIGQEDFKVTNIYAPNNYSERIRFLDKHGALMAHDTSFLIGGDWNCICSYDLDCIGKTWKNFIARKGDRETLETIINQYGYRDNFRRLNPNAKEFTFTGIGPYRARLDRIYIHESRCHLLESTEIHPMSFSDHDLFIIVLKNDPLNERPIWGRGLWKINASLLEKPEILDDIETEWELWRKQKHAFEDQLSWWEFGKRFLKTLIMDIGRAQRRHANDRKADLIKELKIVSKQTGLDSAMKIRRLKNELVSIEEAELDGAAVRSRSDWNQKGEKSTRYFFDLEKKNGQQKVIRELECNGRKVSGKTEVLSHIHDHFERHFTATAIDQDACTQLVNTITNRISEDESRNVERPFTLDELEAVHRKMKPRKSPGNDGLSYEFYKATWYFIKYDLLDTINEILIRKELPVSMTQSILTLIFKNKGSDLDLRNYRAISLLNVDYKYMAAMLNARISPLLKDLVHVDQGGGLDNRLIEDQLIMIQNIYDHCTENNRRSMIEAKDLSCAFDLCSHDYLFMVLKAMNFGDSTVNLLKAIYLNMYTAVAVNGAKTKYFRLSRSIRQGDPGSVTWFVLAMEPLGNMIRASQNLHPITIPNQEPKLVNMFVDDTSVFTTDPRDHAIIEEITKLYESGTGAKFNPTKAEILLMGHWTETEKSLLPKENIKTDIKLLGVWFGSNAGKLNRDSILNKIDKATEFWRNINLSFQGKKLIIETKILSQITHVARITGIDKILQKEVQKRITEFFWYPRKMALIAMATLQNEIQDGGLKLPKLEVLHKAILAERIAKGLRSKKPWMGQLIYRNGFTLRKIDPNFASSKYAHTFKQTPVSSTIQATYTELKDHVQDWSKENLRTLQRRLYVKYPSQRQTTRDYSDTWQQIQKSTSDRKCRDVCYLVGHDSLPLSAMLKRRHVTDTDTCQLCRKEPESTQHVFLECAQTRTLKRVLEKLINPTNPKTLTTEEMIFHEGATKSDRKANKLIAAYKHSIWVARAKLYYGEITRHELRDVMLALLKQKSKSAR